MKHTLYFFRGYMLRIESIHIIGPFVHFSTLFMASIDVDCVRLFVDFRRVLLHQWTDHSLSSPRRRYGEGNMFVFASGR